MSNVVEVKAIVVNKLGLHARPAMVFVDLAGTFKSEIKVRKDDNEVDGKSIMMMMMLAAARGRNWSSSPRAPTRTPPR